MKSKIPGRVFLKIYFTEALYTLCNFPFLQPHFCHVNRVSGIGDDWLRRIIFSIIPVKKAIQSALWEAGHSRRQEMGKLNRMKIITLP